MAGTDRIRVTGIPVLLLTAFLLGMPVEARGITSLQERPVTARQDTIAVPSPDTILAVEGQRSSIQDSLETGWTSLESDGTVTTFTGSPEEPAWVRTQDFEMRAGIIIFDNERELISAFPLPDTSATGEGKPLHLPLFKQGGTDMVGERMYYDLRSNRGKIYGGRTTYEFGYYYGSEINAYRSDPDYLTILDSRFTTCELDDPHYWFSSKQMKIIPDDKMIAKGIRFHLLGIQIPPRLFTIPLLNLEIFPPLPFIIKSIRSGRQSGLLMPQYSNNNLTGVTLRGLGYYWAPSEHFDARLVADFTQKVGVIVRGRVRYKWRYMVNGNIETTYNNDRQTGVRRWETRFNHSQTINPTLRISARGNFSSSSDFNKRLSDDLERRLQRVLRSNANLSKRFSNGSNLSVALSQTNYLDRGITDTQLPTATYRISRRPLFGGTGQSREGSGPGGLSGFGFSTGRVEESALPKWYENFYIDYSMSLRSSIRNELQDMGTAAERDSITQQIGMEQKTNLTYSGKVFGWLNLQPSFSAREAWYFGDTARDGFQRRFLWNSSLRASAKIYGILDRPFGANVAFRHVVEPSLSLTYAPDFSHFDDDDLPSLYGGNPGGQQRLNYSLNQTFQMKRWVGEEEKQFELARITTSGSYNARAEGRKLSDINTSLITKAGRVLNLQLRALHSFYEPGTDTFRQKPIMMTASYRSSLRLDNRTVAGWFGRRARAGEAGEEEPESGEIVEVPETEILEEEAPFGVPTRDAGRLKSPSADRARAGGRSWNLAVSHNYSWRRSSEVPTHSLDGSLTANIPKWTLSVTSRYDFARKELVRMSFNIYRDLHCWEARLQVVPTGPGRGYWFVIAIKDIPEIKYEQRRTVY